MPITLKQQPKESIEQIQKLEVIRIYYDLVKKGYPPEQTRKDLQLSFNDVEGFDFSVFNKAV